MQVQTDFSHPLKLNCSSIASSTPGNNVSFPEGQLIKFEQFNNQSEQKVNLNFGHKKRLTIEINDSYDFNQNSMIHSQIAVDVQSATTDKDSDNVNFFKKHEKNNDELSYCIGESQSPSFANSNSEIQINKILSYNAFLEQKIKYLQKENNQLKTSLNSQKTQMKVLKTQNESLKITIKKKDQAILHEKERLNKLSEKLAQMEEQKAQHAFYDERLREKQAKNQELLRKLQKITNMNKAFQKELKQSDKKIMELEKEVQRNFCQNQQETISRIKESSVKVKDLPVKSKELIPSRENKDNKENLNSNNMGNTNTLGSTIQMRKSIDKKKCSQSQGKKSKPTKTPELTVRAQRASSSSNIVAKKLLTLKKQ